MVSAQYWGQWRRCELLVCNILRGCSWNVSYSCPYSSLVYIANLTHEHSIGVCGVYYYVWIKLLPRLQGFKWEQTVLKLDDGALAHRLVRVPKRNA